MLLKECKRCGRYINYGSAYCPECKQVVHKEKEASKDISKRLRSRRYNRQRDPKYQRFYRSADWRKVSLRYTQEKGYRCEQCGTVATQVHHRQPIQTDDGWDRRFDLNNLELLCTACHNLRHDRFKSGKGRGGQKSF